MSNLRSAHRGIDIYTNEVVYKREIGRRKQLHREWVKATKPTSKTNGVVSLDQRKPESLGPSGNHLRYNPNKLEQQSVRQSTVDHQNRVLLERMIKISQTNALLPTAPPRMKDNHEHNERVRRRYLRKVYAENTALSQRLQNIKPTYPKTRWGPIAAHQEQALRRLGRDRTLGFLEPGDVVVAKSKNSNNMNNMNNISNNCNANDNRNVHEGGSAIFEGGEKEAGLYGYDLGSVEGSHLWEGPSIINNNNNKNKNKSNITRRNGNKTKKQKGRRRPENNGSLHIRRKRRQRVERQMEHEKKWNTSTSLHDPNSDSYNFLYEKAMNMFEGNLDIFNNRKGRTERTAHRPKKRGKHFSKGWNQDNYSNNSGRRNINTTNTNTNTNTGVTREELLFQGRKEEKNHSAALTFFERTQTNVANNAVENDEVNFPFISSARALGFRIVAHLARKSDREEGDEGEEGEKGGSRNNTTIPMMGSAGTAVQHIGLVYLLTMLADLSKGKNGSANDIEVAGVARESYQAIVSNASTCTVRKCLMKQKNGEQLLQKFAQLLMLVANTIPSTYISSTSSSSSVNNAIIVLGNQMCPTLHKKATMIQACARGRIGRVRFNTLIHRAVQTERSLLFKENQRNRKKRAREASQKAAYGAVKTRPSDTQIVSKMEQEARDAAEAKRKQGEGILSGGSRFNQEEKRLSPLQEQKKKILRNRKEQQGSEAKKEIVRKRPSNQPGRGRQHSLATSPIRITNDNRKQQQEQQQQQRVGRTVLPTRPTDKKISNGPATKQRVIYAQPKAILQQSQGLNNTNNTNNNNNNNTNGVFVNAPTSINMPATQQISANSSAASGTSTSLTLKKTASEIELDALLDSDGFKSGGSSLNLFSQSSSLSGVNGGTSFVAGNITDALGSAPDVVLDPSVAEDSREPSEIVEILVDTNERNERSERKEQNDDYIEDQEETNANGDDTELRQLLELEGLMDSSILSELEDLMDDEDQDTVDSNVKNEDTTQNLLEMIDSGKFNVLNEEEESILFELEELHRSVELSEQQQIEELSELKDSTRTNNAASVYTPPASVEEEESILLQELMEMELNETNIPKPPTNVEDELSLLEELESMIEHEAPNPSLIKVKKVKFSKTNAIRSPQNTTLSSTFGTEESSSLGKAGSRGHVVPKKHEALRSMNSLKVMESNDLEKLANLPADASYKDETDLLNELAHIEEAIAEANGETRYENRNQDPSAGLLHRVITEHHYSDTSIRRESSQDKRDKKKKAPNSTESRRRLTNTNQPISFKEQNKNKNKTSVNITEEKIETAQENRIETKELEETVVDDDDSLLKELDSLVEELEETVVDDDASLLKELDSLVDDIEKPEKIKKRKHKHKKHKHKKHKHKHKHKHQSREEGGHEDTDEDNSEKEEEKEELSSAVEVKEDDPPPLEAHSIDNYLDDLFD